ncbi:MAG: hypothetical protein ABW007_26685 [Chitinophagaceae bacterium]
MSIELWKVFVSLGVPGLALGIFYALFRAFKWRIPGAPKKWIAPLAILFMLLTAGVIAYSLSLWAPATGQSSVSISNNANISGSVAGRDISTGEDKREDEQPSQSSVNLGRDSDVSGNVAGRDVRARGKEEKGAKDDGQSRASIDIGENANVSGYVAGRDIVVTPDPLDGRVNELIEILEERNRKIKRDLSKYYKYAKIKRYVDEFDRLHRLHIASLREGKVLLAHERLIEIHRLAAELERDDFWTHHRIVSPGVAYRLCDDAFQRGEFICEYVSGEMRDCKYRSDRGIWSTWSESRPKESYSVSFIESVYKSILNRTMDSMPTNPRFVSDPHLLRDLCNSSEDMERRQRK